MSREGFGVLEEAIDDSHERPSGACDRCERVTRGMGAFVEIPGVNGAAWFCSACHGRMVAESAMDAHGGDPGEGIAWQFAEEIWDMSAIARPIWMAAYLGEFEFQAAKQRLVSR